MLEYLKQHIGSIKRTSHGYSGYCPFPEHSPKNSKSFHINFEKGIAKCFSCNRGMSSFDFLLYCGVPLEEALPYLRTEKWESEENKVTDYEIGTAIPKSFIDRGFTIETLKHFEVGYNRHTNLITIPIYFAGELKGVFYRKYPKFMHYNEGFQKDRYIYNFDKTDSRIITEGFTDTYRIWQNGFKNVSALFNNSAEGFQVNLLSTYKKLYLALDFDLAGLKGMYRINRDLKHNSDIWVIPFKADLGEKNDAGNCSKEALTKGFKNAMPFSEFDIWLMLDYPELRAKIYKDLKLKDYGM